MKIGIIGGSGLENPNLVSSLERKEIKTNYGSVEVVIGNVNNTEVFIISRHGKEHKITPTNVNNRANISALAQLGCTHILATTAVGSLKEEIKREDFVILDQFIDFTKHRAISFHEEFKENPIHVSLADPFSEELRQKIIKSCEELGIPFHPRGCVVTIEGPRFSTRAESNMFRNCGADVINMSIAPEAILAREAGLEYAAIAMSTDYDCWKTDEKAVSWEEIREIFTANADKMKKLLIKVIEKFSEQDKFNEDVEFIKNKIRTIPDFPKQGIMFRDITTLLKDSSGLKKVIDLFETRYKNKQIDVIAGIESRGFLIASALADRLGKGVVLVRKPGKLPAETVREEYELEYGKDAVEIHTDAVKINDKVLVIDDLIATGGTAAATCNLIEKLGGEVVDVCFVIELPELKGRRKLIKWPVYSLVEFEGE